MQSHPFPLNTELSLGVNFGASRRTAGPLGVTEPTNPPVSERLVERPIGAQVFLAATQSERLKRIIARRSKRHTDKHKHAATSLADHDEPFFVTLRQPERSALLLEKAQKGFEFVFLGTGSTIEITIDDHKDLSFLARRFLTPHLAQGSEYISVANVSANFMQRRIGPFTLTGERPGLVQILALDMLGRCRGELVISIKSPETHGVQFVRVHNGSAENKLNHSTLTDAEAGEMLIEVNKIFRSQTGIEFRKIGGISDLPISEDLSQGLPKPVWDNKFKHSFLFGAPITVYLFEKFKLPFVTSDAVAVATGGQFHSNKLASVGWTDKADEHNRGAILLAHELAHAFIPKALYSGIDLNEAGHSDYIKGLMTRDPKIGALSWREVNAINPKGLGPDGLQGLINNKHLWAESGS